MHRSVRLSLCLACLVAPLANAQEKAGVPQAVPDAELSPFLPYRQVSVVQKRRYPKQGAMELEVFAGVIPNDAFVVHVPVGVRVSKHLSEHMGVELSASVAADVDTALRDFLEEEDVHLSAQVRDRQRARGSAGLLWSPIYGKFAWMNAHVTYVEAFFAAGLGAVLTTMAGLDGTDGIRPEAYVGTGLRLFLSPRASARLEVRQHVYPRADGPEAEDGGIATPSELSLGLGFLFGGAR